MDEEKIQETDTWQLYSEAQSYARLISMYTDTDRNFRMYNGNQNEGIKIKSIEPLQLNFIKPIVKFKVGSINQNLWGINYSSENFERKEFRNTANKVCQLLNKKANQIWEKDNMDYKCRRISTVAAVNDECPVYVNYNKETNMPENEILSKNDIYFGNENDSDIQSQPYILIKQRKPIEKARQIAEEKGVPKEKLQYIMGDQDTLEESGDAAKYEKDNMCTIVTKFYKKNGQVYYTMSTRLVDIKKETYSGLKNYPITHMIWEEKEGSARGEGEVRNLIPNQLEVNKTLMRRALVAKNTAYPQKIANVKKITNPSAINSVGGLIKVEGETIQDVKNVFATTTPAQMSSDVEKLQQDLIQISRDLANVSEASSGDIDPESASGRAILAVQNAQKIPLTEQQTSLKTVIEDLARIWLEMIILYNPNGIELEEDITDDQTGEETTQLVHIPASVLIKLQANVKVDITPRSPLDRYAQELSLENLLKGGFFAPNRIGELKLYIKALPDDATMPKQTLLDLIKGAEEEQKRIAQIQAQSQAMLQNAKRFIEQDPDTQASQLQEEQMVQQALANQSY